MTIILLLIQAYSHEPMQVDSMSCGTDFSQIVLKLETRVVCVKTNAIFKDGFEINQRRIK